MSSFPIVPRAGAPDRAPPRAVALPSLDLGKISFAAMGGSAEILHFPENDVAYDVDSSDEDLDGMEAVIIGRVAPNNNDTDQYSQEFQLIGDAFGDIHIIKTAARFFRIYDIQCDTACGQGIDGSLKGRTQAIAVMI